MESCNLFNGIKPGNILPRPQQFFRIAPQTQIIFSEPADYHIDYIGKINNDFVFKATGQTNGYFCIKTSIIPRQLWIVKLYPDIYSALRNTIISEYNRDIMYIADGYINTSR